MPRHRVCALSTSFQGRLGGSVSCASDFGSGHDLTVGEFGPRSPPGSSVSLCLRLPPHVLSLSLSKINIKKKNKYIISFHSSNCVRELLCPFKPRVMVPQVFWARENQSGVKILIRLKTWGSEALPDYAPLHRLNKILGRAGVQRAKVHNTRQLPRWWRSRRRKGVGQQPQAWKSADP